MSLAYSLLLAVYLKHTNVSVLRGVLESNNL